MRIGIDVTPMFRQRGGIGWYTYCLTTSLARIDSNNTYILYRDTSAKLFDALPINQPNFSIVAIPRWRMRHQAHRDAIDIFHGTNYKLPAYGKCGNIITVHDLALDKFPQHSKKLFGQRWAAWRSRLVFARANRLIAVSHNTAHDLHEHYKIPLDKISVVHHGGILRETAESTRTTLELLKQQYRLCGDRYILHVGGGEPRKNIGTLLEAYALLGDLRKHYKLVFIGTMGRWLNRIMQRIRQLALDHDVVITGYVPYPQLVTFYKHAAAFVYPSLYEGFGIPLLEAMERATPVITSNTSSLPEVVGDAAIMVDPLQPSELAQSIRRVLTDSKLSNDLRQKGLIRASQFSWERTASNTLAVYNIAFAEPACDESVSH